MFPVLFFATLLAGAATANAQVKLEIKYAPETTSTTHAETSTKQILTLAGMDLESAGTILFDRDKGAIVELVSKFKIEGDLKTEINGMELPGKLSLTIESKSSLQP